MTPYIVMVGPSSESMGGIASVVRAYRLEGLFTAWPMLYLETHQDGNVLRKLLLGISSLARFSILAIRGRVQGLHLHVAQRTSFWRKSLFMQLAIVFRVPYILHLHGADFDVFYERDCGPAKQRYIRRCFDRAAAVIVLSESWMKWAQGITSNTSVRRIFNPAIFSNMSATMSQATRKPTVLFLGRLGDRKGLSDLLRAFAEVRHSVPDAHLDIGGDGPREPFQMLAADLAIDDAVTIHGWVAGVQKENLLQQAAVLALPSYHEGLPMAILEAMAAGVPVVATTVGGIPDAVENGSEGYLVMPGDIGALAGALTALLCDPHRRVGMGARAAAKSRELFAADRILGDVAGLYRDLGFRQ